MCSGCVTTSCSRAGSGAGAGAGDGEGAALSVSDIWIPRWISRSDYGRYDTVAEGFTGWLLTGNCGDVQAPAAKALPFSPVCALQSVAHSTA